MINYKKINTNIKNVFASGKNKQYNIAKEEELYYCPICNKKSTFGNFGDPVRVNVACMNCGSLERHRFLCYIYKLFFLNCDEKIKVLHMAPEKCLHDLLNVYENVEYVAADLYPENFNYTNCAKEDFTKMSFGDKSFDIILSNQIMEHIQDEQACLLEMRRCLKDSGYIIINLPYNSSLSETYENSEIKTDEERKNAYGQIDHVRLYGNDAQDRLRRAGYIVNKIDTTIFPNDFIESNKLGITDSKTKMSGGYFSLRKNTEVIK